MNDDLESINTSIIKLINDVNSYMRYQQKALEDDHPDSTCAAWHKGEIYACVYFLKRIQYYLLGDQNEKR